MSSASDKKVSIKLAYTGTATEGTDYTIERTVAKPKTITFPGDGVTYRYSWNIKGKVDGKAEGNETIVINVTSVKNGTEKGTQRETLTLSDDTSSYPSVSLSCRPSSILEKGGKATTCTLNLAGKRLKDTHVNVRIAYSGTASRGTDYVCSARSSCYAPGRSYANHKIPTGKTSTSWTLTGKADTRTEGNETIVVDVTYVYNATEKGTQRETVTLKDVAETTPTVSLTCTPERPISEKNGKATCKLSLSKATTKKVTAKVAYSGTAKAGTDYSGNTTSHTIAAGKTSTSWTLTGKADSTKEGNETIVINVTSVTNATEKGTQRETVTLKDGVSTSTIVKLTTPNGGEKWATGKRYNIKWGKGSGNVKIELLKSGKAYLTIHNNTKNDGRLRWKIPSSVATGSAYKIKITSKTNSNTTDSSDRAFTITKAGGRTVSKDGDYTYLNRHNAYKLDGQTVRWKSKTIQVSGASGAWRAAVNQWPTVKFRHVSSPPAKGKGIEIAGYDDIAARCGVASVRYWDTGEMESCRIRINSAHANMNCGSLADTVTHEVGHCIGVFKHTTDGGLMDATTACAPDCDITSPVKNMIRLLYSLSPGTDISSKLARRPATLEQKPNRGKNRPKRKILYSFVISKMEHGVTKIEPSN